MASASNDGQCRGAHDRIKSQTAAVAAGHDAGNDRERRVGRGRHDGARGSRRDCAQADRESAKVPIAVSVFSAESLESKGIDTVVGIADYSPNVTLDFTSPISGASSALVAFIRGIGQSDFAINFEPGVGIYVDGVYYARTIGSVIDLMDVERIEVLKGPQGTFSAATRSAERST